MRPASRSSWLAHGAALVLFIVVGLVAQRTLATHASDHVYGQPLFGNDSLLHVWSIAWGQHALATDPRHVFDGNIFFPQRGTLLYSDHLLGLAVLLAPLRLVTDNVVLVHNLAVLAAPTLNALAVYALVFDLTAAAPAAIVAGLLYGFAPLRFEVDRAQVQMLAAWWLPLVLWCARRALLTGRWRWALGAGLALLGQGATGVYLTAFFAPFLALAHVHWLGRFPVRDHARGWVRLVLAEAATVVALLPTALAYRALQSSLGASRSVVLNALLAVRPSTVSTYLPLVTTGVLLVTAMLGTRRSSPAFRREARLYVAITFGALLLALGPAITLPNHWGSVRGPYTLLMLWPGFTALRTPGRMVHIALLGIAVMAGGGIAGLTAARHRWTTAAIVIPLIALIGAECRTPVYPVVPAPSPPAIAPVYEWLATRDDTLRLLEFPIGILAAGEQEIQYASTWHWKPIVNGNMGIIPPAYAHLRRAILAFPDAEVLGELRALGVTHVLVHEVGLPMRFQTKIARALDGPQPHLRQVFHADGVTVYTIRPDLAPPHRELPGHAVDRARWIATATEDAPGAVKAIDDDDTSAWRSWGTVEDRVTAAWYDAVPVADHWDAFLARQPATLAIDFGASTEIAAVTMRLAGSDPAAPATLRLETSPDGVTWTLLPGFPVPLPDVTALVENSTKVPFALLLASPVRARHLRLRCASLEWVVQDLAVHAP